MGGLLRALAGLPLILLSAQAHAQTIGPDRPGIGSDPEVVPPFTLEPEIGTDSREVRLGLLQGFEIDGDDTGGGAKLALVDGAKFKASVKLSYDTALKTVIEMPANYIVNSWFYLGTDVIWSRTSRTYAAEFNLAPTTRLTVTPTLYYDTRMRGAIFAAWVPPGHDNVQFDIGYDQHKVSVGISTAINLARLAGKR